jgi:hypothetical protein
MTLCERTKCPICGSALFQGHCIVLCEEEDCEGLEQPEHRYVSGYDRMMDDLGLKESDFH